MLHELKINTFIQRIGSANIWIYVMRAITISALVFATYIAINYIQQPLADVHAFRQTQTALTSYWMLEEGWKLAYQTPVAGYPWSIPFEFPIYQALVAAIAGITGLDLVIIGRFISYIFLVACAWPAFAVNRRLELPNTIPWVFCTLLWTSPLYVYWGRTFMIETAALFFSLACIPYAIDLFRRDGGWHSVFLFVAFATAAVLQKSTTGGPVLLFLALATTFVYVRQFGLCYEAFHKIVYPIVIICIPLVIGLAWAHYADLVKMDNPFGSQLTSGALKIWNFGTIDQKMDLANWRLVLWDRAMKWNGGGLVGVILLLLPWFGRTERSKYALLVLSALILFILPFLIFTNLHVVHEYYQVSSVAFMLAAFAIIIGGWLKDITGTMIIVPFVTTVFYFLQML